MKTSGYYDRSFAWMQRTGMKDATYGQVVESWVSVGTLWGNIVESTGNETAELNAVQAMTTATIKLRQYPKLSAKDRLIDKKFGDTWLLSAIRKGDNEVIVEAVKLEGNNI